MVDEAKTYKKKQTSRRTDVIDQAVGRSLRRFRKEAGWTQKQLGDAIGMSFKQVRKYEVAENRISASALFAVSLALGRQVDEFYDLSLLEDGTLSNADLPETLEDDLKIRTLDSQDLSEAKLNEIVSQVHLRQKLHDETDGSREDINDLVENYYLIKDKKQRQVFLELVRSISTEFS